MEIQVWLDVYLGKFKWYRKTRKGTWYKHQFTKDAEELTFPQGNTWWAKYGKLNRYSNVIKKEFYKTERKTHPSFLRGWDVSDKG